MSPDRPTVGQKLRDARHARGLTIAAVGEATGLTKGFLSRLERDEVSASVPSLLAVCQAVGLRIGDLFDPPSAAVVRHNEGSPLQFGGHGLDEVVMSSGDQRRFTVIRARLSPDGTSGSDLYTFDGDVEFAYVVSGQLTVNVERQSHVLEAGDALTFRATQPHRWHNSSGGETVVLWVLSPAP